MPDFNLSRSSSWTEISTVPCTVQNRGDKPYLAKDDTMSIEVIWGASLPASTNSGFILKEDEIKNFDIPAGTKLYARNAENNNSILVIVGA